MRARVLSLTVAGIGCLAAGPLQAQAPPAPPTAEVAVRRACDAAGGLEAFQKLGILGITQKSDEVMQDGTTTSTTRLVYLLAPGPLPGRFEVPKSEIVGGDDGGGGWALVGAAPDGRPATTYMVKRSLARILFPLLFPFSLTWDGVDVKSVEAAEVNHKPTWRLHVQLPHTMFDTPQVSTTWTVDVDRTTFAVVEADSPATDLGKGVQADGMRITWRDPVRIANVKLYGVQRVVGLNEAGQEKTHSRIDTQQYRVVPASQSERLFANPIPPDKRPTPPVLRPPGGGAGGGAN